MDRQITADAAPALGDVRAMPRGSTLVLVPGVESRRDWPRYAEAIGGAVSRGVDVRWVR